MRAALLAALAVCAAEGTTMHYMSDTSSVYSYYSTPQEWDISCTAYDTIAFHVKSSVSGYTLKVSYTSLYYGYDQYVTCPYNGKLKLVYTPENSGSHLVRVSWTPRFTSAPTPYWYTPVPTPSPATMHYMSDSGSVDSYYSTPQEWSISCTPYSTVVVRVTRITAQARLSSGGSSLYSGSNYKTCSYSGKISLLYTPTDRYSHLLTFNWGSSTPSPYYGYTSVPTPSPGTVRYMSDSGSINAYYYNTQVWSITCRSYSTLYVTVTELSGTLTADTKTLYSGFDHYPVTCPYTGQLKLTYVPYSGTSHDLGVRWSPDAGDDSQSISPLLIALVATAGVLVLVGLTVAVYCGCSGKSADPNAYSSNVQVEGYADVVHTGGSGRLQDSYVPPAGQQSMSEMDEQLLPADSSPVM
eukprot:TRINITY_DN2468_c0_g1_i1.p1 TRINITY_DN2468_c0_g1~~TRINITY_DN2468_c0_g1_i1.p1  ORF type:complete len:427 (+),score=89.24 TRINITY_DN2468_c0_g1_i1:49-1281(+)